MDIVSQLSTDSAAFLFILSFFGFVTFSFFSGNEQQTASREKPPCCGSASLRGSRRLYFSAFQSSRLDAAASARQGA